MTLTPIVADTATASATMATPVRLMLVAMPATAMRDGMPPSRSARPDRRVEAMRTTAGTHSA